MTGEEVEKYINQVAFSGAEEFLKNIKILQKIQELSDTSVLDFTLHSWLQKK
jgi:hypothetical protein